VIGDATSAADRLAWRELGRLLQASAASVASIEAKYLLDDTGPPLSHDLTLIETNAQLVIAAVRAQTSLEAARGAVERATLRASTDALTGLPNRALLMDRIETAIARALRDGVGFSILFLDLDGFKNVNDTWGHAVGDEVLRLFATALRDCVRSVDTVSRYGGDEFVVLLSAGGEPGFADRVLGSIRDSLAAPRVVGSQAVQLTASAGIAVFPQDGDTPQALLASADAAMYRGRRVPVGSIAVEPALDPRLTGEPRPITPPPPELSPPDAARKLPQRFAYLREANEQLVRAALLAQERQAAAVLTQQQQASFIGVLAHELRVPLGPLRNAAALLGSARAAETLPFVRAVIERQVVHASRLLDDLLDLERIRTGRLRLERSVVDLTQTVAAAVQNVQPAMYRRQQPLRLSLPPGPLPAWVDEVRLIQVLVNLLDNASKYSPEGGEISLSLMREGDCALLTVTDSGIGISAVALHHVFDIYVQEPHAVGYSSTGLGIGLSVARELVRGHGGAIVASSQGLGLGSRFEVTLPLREGGALPAGPLAGTSP
jgi:diguanylate cyclase